MRHVLNLIFGLPRTSRIRSPTKQRRSKRRGSHKLRHKLSRHGCLLGGLLDLALMGHETDGGVPLKMARRADDPCPEEATAEVHDRAALFSAPIAARTVSRGELIPL